IPRWRLGWLGNLERPRQDDLPAWFSRGIHGGTGTSSFGLSTVFAYFYRTDMVGDRWRCCRACVGTWRFFSGAPVADVRCKLVGGDAGWGGGTALCCYPERRYCYRHLLA